VSETESPQTPRTYESLGLVANPFAPTNQSSSDPYWLQLVVHDAVNRLHVAVLKAESAEKRRPVMVSMTSEVPGYYAVAAENAFLGRTGSDAAMNTLALNVGLDMMRLGRIRGTLAEVAELLAAVQFDQTLAAYCAAVLADPDRELPAFAPLGDLDLAPIAAAFAERPEETVAEYFGTPEYSRAPDAEADMVMHEAYLRRSVLEPDPDEVDETVEDVLGETTPLPEPEPISETALEAPEEETEEYEPRADVVDYVIAHARAHLSPVIARGLGAYVNDGVGALAQELKVTKAPRKTVAAMIRLAKYRFASVVVIYDRFDPWKSLEDDVRTLVLGSLSELRWTIGEDGVMALLVEKGLAPEVEEQFAAADEVAWTMEGLIALQNGEMALDVALLQGWVDAASTVTPSSVQVAAPELAPLVDAAENDILRFARLAAAAIDAAAARGLPALDEQAIAAGMSAGADE
jgi:hypothetical protein